MYVLADFEWVNNDAKRFCPTQLYAIRVDEFWNGIDRISIFFRPALGFYHEWSHIAYTGGTSKDFLNAKTVPQGLKEFLKWLKDDDIVAWWYQESSDVIIKLISIYLKKKPSQKMIVLSEYVCMHLSNESVIRGNSYKIANICGIDTTSFLKHSSKDDVLVMVEILKKLNFLQEILAKPINKTEKNKILHKDFPYQCDEKNRIIHIKDCSLLKNGSIDTIGYYDLNIAIKKGLVPCECCKNEFKEAVINRNIYYINKRRYAYIYSSDSKIYHRYDCKVVLASKKFKGAKSFEKISSFEMEPCKICKPTDNVKFISFPQFSDNKTNEVIHLTAKEEKAIKRQKQAFIERKMKLKNSNLSKAEKKDVYTLTQPRFAFWVGKGYRTFHKKSCPKLNELSDFTGFPTYEDAVRAGYTPCKKCKPTIKDNMTISIPISNRIRKNETIENLETMCRDEGYIYHFENDYFYIETQVGKWKIDTLQSPFHVEHINFVRNLRSTNYHQQPRIFLSLLDAFEYIRRHDNNLQKQKESNITID